MAYFNRFDVCEAWWLHLSATHGGMGSAEYARLSRMGRYFKPRSGLDGASRLRSAADLTSNGLEIYHALTGDARPLIDQGEHCRHIYEMWAGACAPVRVLVRAKSFVDAFEALVEWCDEYAPGMLSTIDYDAAAVELGFESFAVADEYGAAEQVIEHAEAGMSVVGHTQLEHGNAIPSREWGGMEVSP